MRKLKGTTSIYLLYSETSSENSVGHTDVDWGGDTDALMEHSSMYI